MGKQHGSVSIRYQDENNYADATAVAAMPSHENHEETAHLQLQRMQAKSERFLPRMPGITGWNSSHAEEMPVAAGKSLPGAVCRPIDRARGSPSRM
jgi:hypothetical protein